MRRHLLSLGVAGLLGVLVSPSAGGAAPETNDIIAPLAVQHFSLPSAGVRDEAAMVIVGAALIGLAGAVRRAA